MEKIRTILCPVDFSKFSEKAVRYASAFSQQYDARLVITHYVPAVMETAEKIPLEFRDWKSLASSQMENFLSSCKLYNNGFATRIETANPAAGILKDAEAENADLIVMGTHGLSGYEAILMGSVTNKVLHQANIPVLTVCNASKTVLSGDPDEPLLIGRILCPIDPAYLSLQTLSAAMFLARSNRATIFFYSAGEPSATNKVMNDLKEVIAPEKESTCNIQFIQSYGNPVEEIVSAIDYLDMDLVVMGHHSRSMKTLETLGSVTLRVIPRSNCAVLVIRDSK